MIGRKGMKQNDRRPAPHNFVKYLGISAGDVRHGKFKHSAGGPYQCRTRNTSRRIGYLYGLRSRQPQGLFRHYNPGNRVRQETHTRHDGDEQPNQPYETDV